jgi:antitoxin HicB
MRYPVEFRRDDNGTVMITVPDVPGTITFGDDEGEARLRAVDALESMIGSLIAAREDVPPPSRPGKRATVALPALSTAKVELYRAMRAAKIGKAELAKRLGWHLPQVDRILDLRNASRLDAVEAALAALGYELEVVVSAAA